MKGKPNCKQLIWKAKDVESLNRPHDNRELWDFAASWIKRFEETSNDNVAEKLIYLWVTVNAWAAKSVPDLSRNHEDAYLVHCMAKDPAMSDRFNQQYQVNDDFKKTVDEFVSLAPVFQSLWLENNQISPWQGDQNRSDFVSLVFSRDPYIRSRIQLASATDGLIPKNT